MVRLSVTEVVRSQRRAHIKQKRSLNQIENNIAGVPTIPEMAAVAYLQLFS